MLGTLAAAVAAAADYPTRPIRLVVPVPPGGASDFAARLFALKMSEALGQTVVVENRGGAAGIIATEIVSRATPDGYTLLVSSNTTHGIGPVMYRKLPYDPMKDFTHIGLIDSVSAVMGVHQSVPVTTVKDFVALAKAKPDTLAFGSSGAGSTSGLLGELFKLVTGSPITHVPYKGSGLAVIDLTSGQIQTMLDGMPSLMGPIKTGRVKALAALSPKRSNLMPTVPTMAESGYPGVEAVFWYGISGPAGLPKPIVDRISKEMFRMSAMEDVKERFASVGAAPTPMTPKEYVDFIRKENAKWGPVVKAANLIVE
ncbi:MAG: Bug family tripartite tricarboxylate transporter substrate binding protein [Burkholderiales bacterium]